MRCRDVGRLFGGYREMEQFPFGVMTWLADHSGFLKTLIISLVGGLCLLDGGNQQMAFIKIEHLLPLAA